MSRVKIAVMDGKGGGIGRAIVETIKALGRKDLVIYALGTNGQATTRMLAAGADDGATGENAICYLCGKVDLIIGPMALLTANAMLGEITPAMAQAVSSSPAQKLLLPMQRCGVWVVGMPELPLKELLAALPTALERAIRQLAEHED